ncbi:carboxypeptidase-like regulatory domain-containing protein [Aeromicrobium chenweiae]|uniref:Uncharacterized protein n=1 Tax=Aeromicrobium chenweiae TaxID=2079793 RepID=A0A2S0WN08_9ACTN|nr:carboxypeptidase-like regulatory domain-containing protein [Aeromicrobium chenweiae]AWB92697.1 hypothetical protein C3E78_11065 [Aeromicrobium chenweiae]TGN33688.1 carboxypeptidase regulatory-like domain-containing protein [Aeromicrobium chenweiae]
MKHRIVLLGPALVTLVAGLLIATPADAAGTTATLKSKTIAISSKGDGKVAIACRSKHTCKGKLRVLGSTKVTSYSVRGKKTAYARVSLNDSSTANPYNGGQSVNGEYKRKTGVTLRIAETSPKKRTHDSKVTTETYKPSQQITGTAKGVGGSKVSQLRVELLTVVRGGNTLVKKFDNDLSDGYSFTIPLGANNSPSATYRLRITGKDQDGIARSWFWRGTDGKFTGGGRYINEASAVQATKNSDFNADFHFSSIQGDAPTGTSITAVGNPRTFGGASVRRELDYVGCANVFGETAARDGRYRIDFLPYDKTSADKRYMISARRGSVDAWYGRTSERFGSCFDVQNYKYSRSNLIALNGSTPTTRDASVGANGNSLYVDGTFSGFKPTAQGDRWLRLREKVPNMPILDAPVVAERAANGAGNGVFTNVAPGTYWVEIGRRTGCSDWYPSRYSNNRAYFKGGDRASERWKSFRTLGSLPGGKNSGLEGTARHVRPNPAGKAQEKKPSGRAGWMYRSVCGARGAGAYKTVSIRGTGNGQKRVGITSAKGATVRGRITRTGGRTNKEMMVRLSSIDGKRVIRTTITDGSGRFSVVGLPSGRWTIAVNTDSWRGIGRTFAGKHAVSVKRGKSYSVGTLRFKG